MLKLDLGWISDKSPIGNNGPHLTDDENAMKGVWIALTIADAKKDQNGKLVDDPIRSILVRQTLRRHDEKGRKMFVVYANNLVAPETMDLMNELEKRGSLLKRAQTQPGIGGSQRESICYPLRELGGWAVIHQEPEKVDFVNLCIQTVLPLYNEKVASVVPHRTENSLNSYYPFQKMTEIRSGDLAFEIRKETLPINLDEMFGPTAFRKEAEESVWKYNGIKWDAHMAPHDDIAKKGYKIESVYVDYHHPKIQVVAERGDVTFLSKRLNQLVYCTNAILQHHFELYPNIYGKRPTEIKTMGDLKKYFDRFDWSRFNL